MTRLRGHPVQGKGVSREKILIAALALLDQGELTMRALASQLGIIPMSLYHHVDGRTRLLRALSDRVYDAPPARGARCEEGDGHSARRDAIQAILLRYYDAVGRHSQLTVAIFAEPKAFAGVTRELKQKQSKVKHKLETGKWYDLIARVEGDTLSIWIDGKEAASFSSEGISHPTKRTLRLAVPKQAVVDDVKIWRKD